MRNEADCTTETKSAGDNHEASFPAPSHDFFNRLRSVLDEKNKAGDCLQHLPAITLVDDGKASFTSADHPFHGITQGNASAADIWGKDGLLSRGELATKLHAQGVRHIWVDGGVTISQFLASQMVDTMTLSIIPVILGDGLPLFNVIGKEISCRLISSQGYRSGLVQLNYEILSDEIVWVEKSPKGLLLNSRI